MKILMPSGAIMESNNPDVIEGLIYGGGSEYVEVPEVKEEKKSRRGRHRKEEEPEVMPVKEAVETVKNMPVEESSDSDAE